MGGHRVRVSRRGTRSTQLNVARSECYCGNSLSNGASLSLYSTQCNMACSGAPGETCGGPNAITLYSTLSGNALVGA